MNPIETGLPTRVVGLQIFDAHTVSDSIHPVMISHDYGSYEVFRGEIRKNNEQPWVVLRDPRQVFFGTQCHGYLDNDMTSRQFPR